MQKQKQTIIGVGWFDEKQWNLLASVVPDRSQLDATFQDWEAAALKAEKMLQEQGKTVERVPIEVAALFAWCHQQNLPMSAAARAEFVTSLLRYKHTRA